MGFAVDIADRKISIRSRPMTCCRSALPSGVGGSLLPNIDYSRFFPAKGGELKRVSR
jgi:hypothetical protein